jgi:hypothetical protein
MAETFEIQLAKVAGKINRVYMDDHQHRMENGLLYYWNKADHLRQSANILFNNNAPRDVFAMVAGLALEVLLKGIGRALERPNNSSHSLTKLTDDVGIPLSDDERILLEAMTEYILWAGRYPAPRQAFEWVRFWDVQKKQQRRTSGIFSGTGDPDRSIGLVTFTRIWAKLAAYYHQAREARPESSEFSWNKQAP